MIFSKIKNDTSVKKPRSLLGAAFNPDFGASIRPLGEVSGVFLNLLAMIFATQGLFPRQHPALSGAKDAPRLTFPAVLGTAWNNLTISKDTIPQTILFFAVIVILAFAGFGLLIVIFSMFIGHAHAAGVWGTGTAPTYPGALTCASGLFTPCDATNDIALGWIKYLFAGVPMLNYLNSTGGIVPQSTIIQNGLITALGLYSNAILVVAAVVLFYHLASMIVETAHHGVIMGKNADQLWAPIRLVFAIGLLVPLAGGLNTGQYIVIKVAEWGSNMGDQIWNIFLQQVLLDTSNGVPPTSPYITKAVYDTVMSEACMATYNTYINGWSGSVFSGALNYTSSYTAPTDPICANGPFPMNYSSATSSNALKPSTLTQVQGSGNTPSVSNYGLPAGKGTGDQQDICGHYSFQAPTPADPNDTFAQTVQSALITAPGTGPAVNLFKTLQTDAQNFVKPSLQPLIPFCLNGKDNVDAPANTTPIQNLAGKYALGLNGLFTSAASGFSAALANVAAVSGAQGWVSAGAWFNTVVREQADLMDINAAIPKTEPPKLQPNNDHVYNTFVLPILLNYKRYIDAVSPTATVTSTTLPDQQQQVLLAEAGLSQNGEGNQSCFDMIFAVVDLVASWNGVWKPYNSGTGQGFHLGVEFTGANPLAEMAYLGHANINTAEKFFDLMIQASFIGGVGQGTTQALFQSGDVGLLKGIGGISAIVGMFGSAAGGILATLSVVFFTTGFMLAFYLPLIPFFHFFFNSLTWVLSLFEAVIAVPLVALAHLTPKGEGLPGQSAKVAYYFIFNIFLRPGLMVFGLICGYLLFLIAASYMNLLYLQAIASGGGFSHGHMALAHLVYTIIYVVMLNLAANNAFKLISFLPENAMRWMGQQALSHGGLTGDPSQMEGKVVAISGAVDQNVVQAVQGLASKGGEALGTMGVRGGEALGSMLGVPGVGRGAGALAAGLSVGAAVAMSSPEKNIGLLGKAIGAGEGVVGGVGSMPQASGMLNLLTGTLQRAAGDAERAAAEEARRTREDTTHPTTTPPGTTRTS